MMDFRRRRGQNVEVIHKTCQIWHSFMTPEQELELLLHADEVAIARYLSMRVRRERRQLGLSQPAFAMKAGIALRTFKRFELEGSGTIETLARVMVAMGHARGFYTLFPQRPVNKPSLTERLNSIRIAARQQERAE